ncbi:FapA family protein [Serpentinicella sp. ANB-PHB4]|uniref:FapA family protein n=1 Tax=Serpentinicella sp. ANB-PHB4 TaxID=3074076 RepID=UPI0028616D7C|nr:FapA family protein [Serpentinicella sp. ANB-PHB4]MDR5658240.1 FapA family protein [Serpentinicella sp. ANB-PHB4]
MDLKNYLVSEGPTYNEAVTKGLSMLNVTIEEVDIEILKEVKGFLRKSKVVVKLTKKNNTLYKGTNDDKNTINCTENNEKKFTVIYKDEGVYLSITNFKSSSVLQKEINDYLAKKEIIDVNKDAINNAIKNSTSGYIYIAPAQNEKKINAEIVLDVSKNNLYCSAMVLEPDGGDDVTLSDFKKKISELGIVYGIDYEKINYILDNKIYNKKVIIASGTEPQNGVDAKVVYHIDIEQKNTPAILEDGNVDFKQLNLISNVKKDTILAEINPSTKGTNGQDIFGNVVSAIPGKDTLFKLGKNVYLSEDSLKLHANIDGQAVIKNGIINVEEVYEVKGDVDNSTGNITFNGRVIVKGNVKSGFSIDSAGDILVHGVVEGARLTSSGDIILNRGVQGNNQAYLECTGNLIAKYIENTQIRTYGSIEADCLLHSNTMAKKNITISGKKGLIVGGEVRAGEHISAKIIGSHMGTLTKIEVGIDPDEKSRSENLKEEINDIEKKLESLKKTIDLLNKISKNSKLPKNKEEILIKSVKAYKVLKTNHDELIKEFNIVESKLQSTKAGKVHVSKVIYPGAKIVISNVIRQIYDELTTCTLSLIDGEVSVGAYEK